MGESCCDLSAAKPCVGVKELRVKRLKKLCVSNSRKQFNFEKLIAWQKAKELCILVYSLTENLPIEEKYNFCSQIRRSAQSVTSNLAEGSAKRTYKDKARFVNIAFGSLSELNSQFIIANELFNFSNNEESDDFFRMSHELINILSGLLRSYQQKL